MIYYLLYKTPNIKKNSMYVQEVTRGYRDYSGYRRLQEVTRGCRGLQKFHRVARGYRGLKKRVKREYRGLQKVPEN